MLERRNGEFVRALIEAGRLRVCHDLSDGGLVCAAAEMALASGVGITLRAHSHAHAHPYLFGEDQARYLIAVDDAGPLIAAALSAGVHLSVAGEAGGEALASGELFAIPLAQLRAAHEGWLPAYMAARPAALG